MHFSSLIGSILRRDNLSIRFLTASRRASNPSLPIRSQLSYLGEANSVVCVVNRLVEMGEKVLADETSNSIPAGAYIFHIECNHIEALDLGLLSNSNRVDEGVLPSLSLETHPD